MPTHTQPSKVPPLKLPHGFEGLLVIDKPVGWTSHDVVQWVRRATGERRTGHLGTLDPFATGVLPVAVGKRITRMIEYFPDTKAYEAEITFGTTTDTLDCTGQTVTIHPEGTSYLTQDMIASCLPEFTGTIRQQVPLHSAVHVNGKKLYRYAHSGLEVPTDLLPIREVTIFTLTLTGFTPACTVSQTPAKANVWVHCGSGTYIRSLARDLGDKLGCGAHLSALRRTHHGKLTLAQAFGQLESLKEEVKSTDLTQRQALQTMLTHHTVSLETALPQVRWIPHTLETLVKLCQGQPQPFEAGRTPEHVKANQPLLACHPETQKIVAVITLRDGLLRPLKVLDT